VGKGIAYLMSRLKTARINDDCKTTHDAIDGIETDIGALWGKE